MSRTSWLVSPRCSQRGPRVRSATGPAGRRRSGRTGSPAGLGGGAQREAHALRAEVGGRSARLGRRRAPDPSLPARERGLPTSSSARARRRRSGGRRRGRRRGRAERSPVRDVGGGRGCHWRLQEDSLAFALKTDVVTEYRRGAASVRSAWRACRRPPTQQRVGGQRGLVFGQVDAGVQVDGQSARERRRRSGTGPSDGARRAAGREPPSGRSRRSRSSQPGERPRRRAASTRDLRDTALGGRACQISTNASGIGGPRTVEYRAVQHDRVRVAGGTNRGRGEGEREAEERPDGLSRRGRQPHCSPPRARWRPGRPVIDDVPVVAHRELGLRQAVVVGRDQAVAGRPPGIDWKIGSSANSGSPGKYICVISRWVNALPKSEKWMCAGRHALRWFLHG